MNRNKGIILIIASAFFFACMNVFVKLAGDLPSLQKSFFRNFVALIFALMIIYRNKHSLKISRDSYLPMFLRASFGTLGILCNFYAIDYLNVSDASMLNKLSPFFVIVFSYLILKEKVSIKQMICVFLAFGGSLFIIKPGFNMNIIPALIGALGGMSAGLAYTLVRVLGNKGAKGPVIVFMFSTFSCIVTLPFMLLDFHSMSLYQLVILLLAGLSASGGQFAITSAYSYAPARDISIYDYTQIIFATSLSFFILGEMPDGYSVIGYFVIISASILMYIINLKQINN